MEQKRGIKGIHAQSHIETILSFVIFAGFLFTLLIFLNPISQKSTSTAVIDLAERQIMDNLTISFERISLILAAPAADCFRVPNKAGITGGETIIVKDSLEKIKKSKVSSDGSFIYIEATPDERYYVLYYNSTLNSYPLVDTASCTPLDTTDKYVFGLHDSDDLVLYDNILAFNRSYISNYELLKTNLHFTNDFVFSVFNQSNYPVMVVDRQKPTALNILSRNIPLLAVNRDMNRTDVILNLRVW